MVLTWTAHMQTQDALTDILEIMNDRLLEEYGDLTRVDVYRALKSIQTSPTKPDAHLYLRALRHRLNTLEDTANSVPLDEEDALYFGNEIEEVKQAIKLLSR